MAEVQLQLRCWAIRTLWSQQGECCPAGRAPIFCATFWVGVASVAAAWTTKKKKFAVATLFRLFQSHGACGRWVQLVNAAINIRHMEKHGTLASTAATACPPTLWHHATCNMLDSNPSARYIGLKAWRQSENEFPRARLSLRSQKASTPIQPTNFMLLY